MPVFQCPFPDCTYATGDITETLAATMLTIHASGAHTATGTTHAAPVHVEKVKRPTISAAGTSEDWTYFKARWDEYTEATKVTGKDRVIQLLECCEESLRKDLTRSAGGSLANKPEVDVMLAIKTIAIHEENTMVARVELHDMRQDRDETIRSFGARIRGQANVCKYIIPCTACNEEVSYTDEILRDVLIRGVADPEIRLDLLQDKNQDMVLEEVFKFIEAKEAGKRSASKLQSAQGLDYSRSSQYHRNKVSNGGNNSNNQKEQCTYCGQSGHGKNTPAHIRKKNCPAFNETCTYCKRLHHVESCCRTKKFHKNPPPNSSGIGEGEGALFDTLCGITTTKNYRGRTITLDHHRYNHLNDCWIQKTSKPQPFINIKASIHHDDYTALGFTPITQGKPQIIELSAMADTGCQSCLAGLKVVQQLGISKDDLIPVNMKMHAANNNGIQIQGAIIIRFSGTSINGHILETRQMTYVTSDSDKLFLSREACSDLGMISTNFPTVGEMAQHNNCNESVHQQPSPEGPESAMTTTCNCPSRQVPPPKPTALPLPANDANREQLQQWLLDYYKSSTFNTCEHQPLPMMEGPPSVS